MQKYLEINLKKLGKYINNELLDKNVKLNIQENYDLLNTGNKLFIICIKMRTSSSLSFVCRIVEMQELSAKYDLKRYIKWVERVEKIKIQVNINQKNLSNQRER